MAEVLPLVRGVDADGCLEAHVVGAVAARGDLDGLRLAVLQVSDLERLLARQAEREGRQQLPLTLV